MILNITDLKVSISNKEILKGLNLKIGNGQVHAIMGPNGSGKSTLAQTIVGHPEYKVTSGDVIYNGSSILESSVEERAIAGIFLSFQYPVEIPGVGNIYFLRTALNSIRKAKGFKEIDAMDFLKIVKEKMKLLDIDPAFINRSVNEGFSGGEKKRNEILQMSVLEPRLAVLDEIDSGLDIDSLRILGQGIEKLKDGDRSILIITHYRRLLEYIKPDHVHVMVDGRIIRSGDYNLALELEKDGYAEYVRV